MARLASPRADRWHGWSGLLALGLLLGCGDESSPALVPVKGRVFLDQTPLAFGTVMFQPRNGQPATGEIQADGNFELSTLRPGDGVAPGMHKVRVTCYEMQNPNENAPGPNEDLELGESLIPIKYTRFATSGIEVAILSSGNQPVILRLESDALETNNDNDPQRDAVADEAADAATESQ